MLTRKEHLFKRIGLWSNLKLIISMLKSTDAFSFISSPPLCSVFIIFLKKCVSYEIVTFETLGISFAI